MAFWHDMVMLVTVMMRTMVAMRRSVHAAVPHVKRRRAGTLMIGVHNTIVRHVVAMPVRRVPTRIRADAEIAAGHRTAAFAHHVPLALAVLDRDLAGRVFPVLHLRTPMSGALAPLHRVADRGGDIRTLSGLDFAADVLAAGFVRG
jgi:hypothetical protein